MPLCAPYLDVDGCSWMWQEMVAQGSTLQRLPVQQYMLSMPEKTLPAHSSLHFGDHSNSQCVFVICVTTCCATTVYVNSKKNIGKISENCFSSW